MRKAIANLDGIERGDVAVDYATKSCTITVQEGDPDADDIIAAVSESSRYTLKPN